MDNLVGQRFGKLLVIQETGRDKWSHVLYLCLCNCGKEKRIRDRDLLSGNTKSCGCIKGNLKHGHTQKGKHSKTYIAWYGMLSRCNNLKNKKYKDYGGRTPSITVCDRWDISKGGSFENFLADMGESPGMNHSIDRIDNNLGYYKENCKWSTSKEQNRNKRNNIVIPLNGKEICLKDYCKKLNLNYNTILARIHMLRWSIKKALITPVRKYNRKK